MKKSLKITLYSIMSIPLIPVVIIIISYYCPVIGNYIFEINSNDLFSACDYDHVKEAKDLIGKCSPREIERFHEYGESPITMVITRHHLDLLKLMIEKGVNINRPNSRGEAPLFFAMRCADPEYAKCLVENGAMINARSDKCLYDCIKDGIPDKYSERLSLLLRNGAGCEIKAGDYDNYKNISVTNADLDAYLKKYNQIRDYKEREIWLLSCLKKGRNVKNELAKLYMSRSESYLQIANDKKMALHELQEASTFAEDKKMLSEIKSKITAIER